MQVGRCASSDRTSECTGSSAVVCGIVWCRGAGQARSRREATKARRLEPSGRCLSWTHGNRFRMPTRMRCELEPPTARRNTFTALIAALSLVALGSCAVMA